MSFPKKPINKVSKTSNAQSLYFSMPIKKVLQPFLTFYKKYDSSLYLLNTFINYLKDYKSTSIDYVGDNIKNMEINDFNQSINSKESLFYYLKISSSLYHFLCSWFIKFPLEPNFIKSNKIHTQKHHIFCKYLMKFGIKNIEVPFNLIEIPYGLHFLLHAIKATEFCYSGDYGAIQIFNSEFFRCKNTCSSAASFKKLQKFDNQDFFYMKKVLNNLKYYFSDPEFQKNLLRYDKKKKFTI